MNESRQSATTKADNLEHPTAQKGVKHEDLEGKEASSNNANNNSGTGSPYAGTQSSDPNAPDGAQQPIVGDDTGENTITPNSLGLAYEGPSSYGKKAGEESQLIEGTPDAEPYSADSSEQ
jgi:hypothetical protein